MPTAKGIGKETFGLTIPGGLLLASFAGSGTSAPAV